MKVKNLLASIFILGLSLNAFSQERITIKQVIKNSSNSPKDGDAISTIRIWTDLPVIIKSGKENAIYLSGDMKENEREKLSSFCVLRNNVFKINSPYLYLDDEFKAKDFSNFIITLELADNVSAYFLRYNSNVIIEKDILLYGSCVFNLGSKSKMTLEGDNKFGIININAQEGSKIRFNSIDAQGAVLTMAKGSIIDLNGKVKDIEIMGQEESSELIGNYKSSSVERHNLDIKDEYKKDKEEKSPSNIISKASKKTVFEIQFSYGILNWSKKGWFNDNFFSHTDGIYSLSNGNSWNLGFRYKFKLNKRWDILAGLGYESNIFQFNNNVMLNDIGGEKRIEIETNPSINSDGRLVARYITIPVFYKYRLIHNRSFYLHGGLIAGVNFRTSSTGFKRKYDMSNAEVEENWGTKYDNFKPLKLDLQAGFGWNSLNFYVKYAIIPLFKDNREMEVYPYSVGISFRI